ESSRCVHAGMRFIFGQGKLGRRRARRKLHGPAQDRTCLDLATVADQSQPPQALCLRTPWLLRNPFLPRRESARLEIAVTPPTYQAAEDAGSRIGLDQGLRAARGDRHRELRDRCPWP